MTMNLLELALLAGGTGTILWTLARWLTRGSARIFGRRSIWTPDTDLKDAVLYVGAGSHWAAMTAHSNPTKAASLAQIEEQLLSKLASGQIAAWARESPNGREHEVARTAWTGATIHLGQDHAFLPAAARRVYRIRFSGTELRMAWPPR